MAKRIKYELEVIVDEEFEDSFMGIDTLGIEQYIENCHPEIQYASISEVSE
jgi:hypothetical protein